MSELRPLRLPHKHLLRQGCSAATTDDPAGWLMFVALGTGRQTAAKATPTRDALPLRIVNHCLQSLHWLRYKQGRGEHASHVLQVVQLQLAW